jgi:hypothetical protein
MSRITIAASRDVADANLVRALRSITGESVSAIAEALKSGGVLFDVDLFARPAVEQFSMVRRVLEALQSANVQPLVHEDGRLISAEILRNIMQSSEQEEAEFERLSDLGHEA